MKSETSGDPNKREQMDGASLDEINLLELLPAVWTRRRFILSFVLAVVILTSVAVLCIRSEYTATTVVLPPGQSSSMNSALLSQLGGSGVLASAAGSSLGIKNPGDMYVSLFRSRTIEDAVVQRFGLLDRYREKKASDARVTFESHSTVILGVKDGLITITVTDHDPKLAADIANGYVDEFRKFSADLAITEASQRRVFFQQQLLEANEDLLAAEDAMKGTEQSTGVFQIDSQTRSLVESAAALRAEVMAKEVQLQGMRSYATEVNPDVVRTNQELSELKAQLANLSGNSQGSNSGLILPKGKIPEAAMEYTRKLRDVKYYETISDIVAKQFEAAKLDEARQGAGIQVVDAAVVPDRRSFPKRSLTVIVATIVSFLAACAWCILREGLLRVKQQPFRNSTQSAELLP
jgi:uncharacterized protein involved in exopolysaccharide biosynthesis